MDGAESLWTRRPSPSATHGTPWDSGYAAAGSTVHLIDTGLSAADETGGDLLTVLEQHIQGAGRRGRAAAGGGHLGGGRADAIPDAPAATDGHRGAGGTGAPPPTRRCRHSWRRPSPNLRALDAAVDDLSIAEMRGPGAGRDASGTGGSCDGRAEDQSGGERLSAHHRRGGAGQRCGPYSSFWLPRPPA